METLSRSGAFIINSQRLEEPAERAQKRPQKGEDFDDETALAREGEGSRELANYFRHKF